MSEEFFAVLRANPASGLEYLLHYLKATYQVREKIDKDGWEWRIKRLLEDFKEDVNE